MSQEQWSAWFDKSLKESDVEDTQKRLENAGKRFEKAVAEYERSSEKTAEDEEINAKELQWLEAVQKSEEEYHQWLTQFKKSVHWMESLLKKLIALTLLDIPNLVKDSQCVSIVGGQKEVFIHTPSK